ncbi:MAG: hypothetical protein BRC44_08465 [Cyanobacteria bacterium QS_4_48_99]|nr:MAG: hypothetical protein BRC44_08465 [Cyanobacteria bacterium QS_4_48_99]
MWFHYLKSAVIQLDNAKAHSAQILTVAKNVVSSVSASLLPGGQSDGAGWQQLKRWLQWRHFDSIADLQQAISRWVPRLKPQQMQSLTQWGWLVDGLCVAAI